MSFDMDKPPRLPSSSKSGTKSYRAPTVLEYGTLRDITMMGQGRNGNNDHGQGGGNEHSIP
jgi:hypothetical protein